MAVVFGWFLLAIACGIFADRKGRSGVAWFFIAMLASPLIAGIFLLALPEAETSGGFSILRRCVKCREQIRRDAQVCKHCNSSTPFVD